MSCVGNTLKWPFFLSNQSLSSSSLRFNVQFTLLHFYLSFLADSHPSCLNFYKLRYDVQNWHDLKNKLINLTRHARASRTSLKRKLQDAAFAARKKDAKTITQSINQFRNSVSLANYRLCVLCAQYFLGKPSNK